MQQKKRQNIEKQIDVDESERYCAEPVHTQRTAFHMILPLPEILKKVALV